MYVSVLASRIETIEQHGEARDTIGQRLRMLLIISSTADAKSYRYDVKVRDGKRNIG